MIADNELQDQVRLVGHCSDVPAALALAGVSVVASVEPEAFGRAAVEAQAAGVPVIVSDHGAVPETVLAPPEVTEEERTGWRVVPDDAMALAVAINAVLAQEPEMLDAMRTRALDHVNRNFSVETMCSRTLDVYASVLDQAASG